MSTTATVDLVALHDALDSTRLAAFIAEAGDLECTDEALLEASAAAASAFPQGSVGAGALKVIFDAIRNAAVCAEEGSSR
ncbi:MAG TPA: hypothetical protein VF223_24445 [Trebonia sp.]